MRPVVGGVAWVLAVALAGCDAPRPATPKLWTVADVQALYRGGASPDDAIATDAGLPGGVALKKILGKDSNALFERATITEGYGGSYLTTEVWSHFDEVWLQPMYIPVKSWAGGVADPLTADGSAWIFSVGPRSRFYSPFWQMVYFDVPEGTQPGDITSARQVLDGKYPLHFGVGRTVSLVPGDVVAPAGPNMKAGWVDGQQTPFVDFGKATFSWNDQGVIDEVPIFVFLMRSPDGSLAAPDIPTVAGTGPLGSRGQPAPQIGGQPRYVAYWRLYTVTLPPTARVFSLDAETQMELTKYHLPTITQYPDAAVASSYKISGWVTLNPGDKANMIAGCLDTDLQLDPDPTNVEMGHCIWLSSQAAIERNIDPSAIRRTDVTVTCPFVSFNGTRVSPVQ